MTIYHVVSFEKACTLASIYFLSYALIQIFSEVLLLVLVGNIIKASFHKTIYYGFISLCFLFFTLHYADFVLVRYMGISVYYSLHWVFDESLENFIELLHLTGISIGTWIFLLVSVALFLPLFAIIFYTLTGKLAEKKPVKVTHQRLVKTLCCLPIGLLAMDMTMTSRFEHQQYYRYEKILPWKSTLLSRSEVIISMENFLKKLPNENETLKKVHSIPMKNLKKPNIYLFIVESLRQDFLTEKIAKNIKVFRDENMTFKKTFSSANATQISWYSIFHSNYPIHWAEAKEKWKAGSIPLQLLKKMGYKIHVYSAAQLKYYALSDVIFGKKHYLADSYHVYPHYYPTQAWESDVKVVDAFMHDLDKKGAKEGNIYVFFLESTHFNYNWPENYPVHFNPISEEKTHLRVSNSLKNIELIKNRYRNAIHFMDSLFGNVLSALKNKGIYDESIVIFTGDHGEEFFEEGQLFHASHLSPMQTEPPIYMKLGDNQRAHEKHVEELVISHIDIFPTILDCLIGEQPFQVFDGESIFKDEREGYVVSGRFNGPRAPKEILISNGQEKGIFRLVGKKTVEVRSIKGNQRKMIEIQPSVIQEKFAPAFSRLFNQ
ncbi:MAG: sulfatase-like hydrolase/transferase [Simkaniaceae bacterium]|nr:sulfatase-like hydrolase/transferase [Simkaniaceae bacterium]